MSENLTVDVIDTDGKAAGKVDLPADVFDVQEYRQSLRRAGMTEEQRAADNERARGWIAANRPN